MSTSDGINLRTEVMLPEGTERTATVLVRTPYSEPMQRSMPFRPLLDAGYAVVVQYCRGTFGSDGELVAFENETNDGLDACSWIRNQVWSDGRIFMMGASYLGMTQNAIAWQCPEGLVGMIQIVTTHDYRNGLAFQQGAVQLGQALGWHQLKTVQTLQDKAALGEDVSEQFRRLGQKLARPEETYRQLPISDQGVISETLGSWNRWIDAENDPGYWEEFNFAGNQHLAAAPALHIGGWYDLFLRGTLGNFMASKSGFSPNDVVSRRQRLIIGPWTHTERTGTVGEESYPSGSENAVGLERLQLSYIDSILGDRDPDFAPVTVFVMGSGRWRAANEWPLPGTDFQEWFLSADGRLSGDTPISGSVEFTSDPRNPVPTVGGSILMSGGPNNSGQYHPGARDRSILDERADIIRWESRPLETDLEITGPVRATIWAAANMVDADIAIHLSDVDSAGRAIGMVDGYVRLRYRNGMDSPQFLTPEEPVEVEIDLAATGRRVSAGHRLRVEIAGSDFPTFDRNPGTGQRAKDVTENDLKSIRQTIYCGPDFPSRITLPVQPDAGSSS